MANVSFRVNGSKLAEVIATHDLKRWWVAEMVGVNEATLRRWINGRSPRMRAEHVAALANVLELSTARLLLEIAEG